MVERGDDRKLDELIERYVADVRAGATPSVDAIADAHPEIADELRALLPAAVAIERSAARPEQPVESFPGLEILFEIAPGSGGMGRVYAARETSLDRVVAVKTTQEHMRTQEGREFFVREARAAAGLDHPNVVKVFHFDPDHAPPYYVMQYVDGRPLDEACRGRDVVLIARIVEQVARGLDYAHQRGIVHRDVKPANVLVSADGVPHITDFGLARPLEDAGTGDVQTTTLKGTPRFIAPEVYEGETNPGPTIDVYALGVTLYELLCGRPAFEGADMAAIRAAVLEGEPEMPQKLAPHVPEPLQRICLKALERAPEDRYATALDMAEDLRRFYTGEPVRATPKRYRRAVRGKLQTHVAEIRLWHEQNLLPVHIADRLLRPYRLTLQDDSPWSRLARAHPFASTILRLAAVALLVSSILWPAYYWEHLSSLARVLAVGLPTIMVNAVGWMFHARGNRPNAAIFLSTGTLMVPLLLNTVLTEFSLARFVQRPEIELFDVYEGGQGFAPTNVQIALSLLGLLWYSAFAMVRAHARVLSIWTGIAWYLFYASALLVGGMKELIENERVAMVVLVAIPATLTFVYVAYRTRSLADGAWSTIFFVGFPVPFAVLMTLLARFATDEWLHAGDDWDEVELQVLLMANGLIYLLAASLCRRGWSSAVRFWNPFFLALVAISLITPAHVAFDEGTTLLTIGKGNVTAFGVVALVAPVAFAIVGTRRRRGTLVLPGLVGFGAFLLHFTAHHFDSDRYVAWALALAVGGAATMIASATLIILRGRRSS